MTRLQLEIIAASVLLAAIVALYFAGDAAAGFRTLLQGSFLSLFATIAVTFQQDKKAKRLARESAAPTPEEKP